MASMLKIGQVQTSCSEDAAENLEKTIAGIRDCAAQGANIVTTQELFLGPYFCQVEDVKFFALAEQIPGPTTDRLCALAKELGIVIVASLFEKRDTGLYHNTAAVIDADGSYLGKYRKMHIPDDPQYYEKFYFTPGDLGFRTWDTKFGRIGVLICWDQWFPEGARLTALSGAKILFYPTAIGWLPQDKEAYGIAQHDAWETVQRGHAIANGVFVVSTNRVGLEGTLEFFGQSFIADPFGRVVHRASENAEQNIVTEIDLEEVERTRHGWPFLRDRRIESYGEITKRLID